MLAYLRKTTRRAQDTGATAVEYGLMVAAIAAVIVAIVFGLGSLVTNVFTDACSELDASATATGDCTP